MKCAICKHGETQAGFTSIVLEKHETTLVFKQVPVQICDNCGEEYISAQVNQEILEKANQEVNRGISVELLNFSSSSFAPTLMR